LCLDIHCLPTQNKKMNVLLIGSGGREHAIAHALATSEKCSALFIAPGNPGTFQCGENVPINGNDIDGLVAFAKENTIDMTFVGPEQPLALGIVDAFNLHGLRIVGPNKAAAQLEGSKAWAKAKYDAYGIPTAHYQAFTAYDAALDYVKERASYPIVIKADGLAAGKGVTIAQSLDEAKQALHDCFVDQIFKDAGNCVVIEDFLQGEEASIFAFTDGKTVVPMVSAQDHKAIFDGDKGPNTGGMGAYSPAPVVTDAVVDKVMARVFTPLIEGFQRDGITYKGVLYAGLMITDAGDPYVVEFNIRFGDPETQIVLPKLDTDFLDILIAIDEERLDQIELQWKPLFSVCVVMAAKGYPGNYESGHPITGIHDSSDANSYVFHAGSRQTPKGEFETSGGRVLTVCGEGETLKAAIDSAYERCKRIHFDGAYYRTDIGQKGLTRLKQAV
jgi:phosphoribosylamine--glycine ligase